MVFNFFKKYRDFIYLIIACIAIVYFVNVFTGITDKELQYKMEINNLKSDKKMLQKSINLLDDSLKKSAKERIIVEKVDKKLSKKRKDIIQNFNEKVYKDSSLTSDSVHIIFTRFYQHEDSVYRGFIEGLNISQRESSK